MADILFLVRSKNAPIVAHRDSISRLEDTQYLQRGDVVSVTPEPSAWSDRELTNPDWRLVRANISNAAIMALEESEHDRDPDELQNTHWRRICGFDLEQLSAIPGWDEYVADDTRAAGFFDATGYEAQIEAMIFEKQPADDYVQNGLKRKRGRWSRR